MRIGIRRGILIKALGEAEIDKLFRDSVLEGFRKKYIELKEKPPGLMDRIFKWRDTIQLIDSSYIYMARGDKRGAGRALGEAIYILFDHVFSKHRDIAYPGSRLDDVVEGLKPKYSYERHLMPLRIIKLFKGIRSRNYRDLFNELSSLALYMVESVYLKPETDKILENYRRARRLHLYLFIPLGIFISVYLLIIAILLDSPLLAFIAPFIALFTIKLDSNYYNWKRMAELVEGRG